MTNRLTTMKSIIRPYTIRLAVSHVPLYREENVYPIFIFGSGESGNTLVRRVLMAGPELYIPPETYVLGQIARRHLARPRMDWADFCLLTIDSFATSQDFHMFPMCDLWPLFEELTEMPATERSLARIICEFYDYMIQQAKPPATRWGDKAPSNSSSSLEIDRMFPKAKYVHIMRDGYDVVASYLEMGRYSRPVDAARRRVQSTDDFHAFAETNPHRVIEIRYEDLCTDPEHVTVRLREFFDLEYSHQMIGGQVNAGILVDVDVQPHCASVTQPVVTTSIGKGRREIDSRTASQLGPILPGQMANLGYE